jgi:3,4-dihydroxy 2-butanone 4-phosphate synthase/GTP cyclohydrolase II
MARLPELEVFAREHGLKIGTIADLISYRSRNESLIERLVDKPLDTAWGRFQCSAFRDRTGQVHLALSVGQWSAADEVMVRVHEPLSVLDFLDADATRHSWALPKAMQTLQSAGRGVAVLLNGGRDAEALLGQILPESASTTVRPGSMDLRTYGVGVQILLELGVRRMKLLSNRRRMPSMTGYGLEVTGFVSSND